jgi:predicted CXXCH cytochrome family protein
MNKWMFEGIFLLVLFFLGGNAEARSIVLTKHNLSASGPGTVKATVEKPVCEFCHTPHNAGQAQPLWNKDIPEILYTTYQSSSLKAAVGQPNGASKLCLSCHDGTIALGLNRSQSQPVPFAGGVVTMPAGRSNLGIDLSDDHPVSFVYDSALASRNGQLENPSNLVRPVKLDRFSRLQCTSCHNPHDDQYGKFLVKDNISSALCITCHKKNYWSMTTHRSSNKTWNGGNPNPWPHTSYTTVSTNGCENCHRPHTAGGRERLLNYDVEEENCFPCHNGNVASKNVKGEFNKTYRHPIASTKGVHKPTEDPLWATRHVECVDCHNSHAANSTTANPPQASGRLAGVVGISSSGTAVNPLTYEYQLCYRCHADNPGTQSPVVTRIIFEPNFRQKFKSSNASYHPVEAIGKNPDGPSLIAPYTTSSIIYCTDCHNNDSGPKAGGVGPNGPHGSIWRPILERQLITTDFTTESAAAYALCYKCHNRNSILSDQSFKKHRRHIVDIRTPCTACHDPHGVYENAHLINFDKTIVFPPDGGGSVRFEDRGTGRGACYLKCHNENHPKMYGP